MDIWENASLTEKGADLQNKLMNGETLKITKVKTGAGRVSAMYLRQQTEVANPVQELTIQPATIIDDNIVIPVLLDNIGLTESYELWQVGFYAEDPDEGEILYCIAQAAKGKEIPTEGESPGYSIVWNFHFKNSEENPFELSITPAGLTSMRTFSEHANDVDIHVSQEEKNIFSDKYTKTEIDNKFSAFETNIDWKEAVDTYTDILEIYPKPQDGWTVNVKDTDYTYRFNGTDWVAISSNSIPKATSELDGLMTKEQAAVLNKLDNAVGSLQSLTTSEKQNLVGAVNEVKSQVTQLNSDLDTINTNLNGHKILKIRIGNQTTDQYGQIFSSVGKGFTYVSTPVVIRFADGITVDYLLTGMYYNADTGACSFKVRTPGGSVLTNTLVNFSCIVFAL